MLACGSSPSQTSPGGGGGGAPIALQDLCPVFTEDLCTSLMKCDGVSYCDMQQCIAENDCYGLPQLTKAAADGAVLYDASKVGRVRRAIPRRSMSLRLLPLYPRHLPGPLVLPRYDHAAASPRRPMRFERRMHGRPVLPEERRRLPRRVHTLRGVRRILCGRHALRSQAHLQREAGLPALCLGGVSVRVVVRLRSGDPLHRRSPVPQPEFLVRHRHGHLQAGRLRWRRLWRDA
jgi:hypothetical protein